METLALCIPAYNAARYLPTLLQSAKEQAIPFDEILVFDDCSTDDTAAIAQEFGAKVIAGDVNRGCSFGKNILANAVSADWIHFHDADDDILPGFTVDIHTWIDKRGNDYDVLVLNFNYINADSGEYMGSANHNSEEMHADALKYAITHKIVNFGVYKRDKFLNAGGFDLDLNVLYNEDNAVHQRLARYGLRFDYLEKVTCINYYHPVSMSSSNRLKCVRANYYVLKKTATEFGDKYPAELAGQLWNCATLLAAEQDWEYVEKALTLSKALGFRLFSQSSRIFNISAGISPFMAFWLREKLIRLYKPAFRKDG